MLKQSVKFHSANGKRQILIVDDELINRELLKMALQDDFDALEAADGASALEIIREFSDTLSLILLDLLMPGMHGLDVIRILKNDQDLKDIPIIVLTADQEAEVTSLQLGAADFIPKPYPRQEVILTRVMRAIELSEDRDIILSTERDALTGLYNREYFYRYAQQFDQHHKNMQMDAIVVDVSHFRMINERYGKAYGDDVLRRIGEKVREMVRGDGGIVCRREADVFLVYCPHREDYGAIMENASIGLSGDNAASNRVRLRMGVYANADKTIDIERRFDRAKMAADTIRSSFIRSIAMYDEKLHEEEMYEEQLLEEFSEALSQHQFVVYYQPKFDVKPETPALTSAEALVRWQHPQLGMISPGVFIPLFEANGLIQQLDLYVWRETAAQIREWKQRYGFTLPVSVNVSRVDMYDPNLIDTFKTILRDYSLEPESLLLEITESAYTQDSAQIVDTVNRLRELGFRIEMDDFGTGYSSLNMISSLPVDALKLDMRFIRDAFLNGRDTRLIELIIDIADYLGLPVIAEGVETAEQLEALRSMGCAIVQGYYFSKPVPSAEFERFIEEKLRREQSAIHGENADAGGLGTIHHGLGFGADSITYARIAQALSRDYYSIYLVDTKTDEFVEYSSSSDYKALHVEQNGEDFFEDCRRNIMRLAHPEDMEMALSIWEKSRLMTELQDDKTFSATYRLMINKTPVYINCKVIRMDGDADSDQIVIGVSNVDAQMKRERDLNIAREKINRDALTGVKSKHAYNETIRTMNDEIAEGDAAQFAIAVCDVNGLKTVNDTLGHAAGDKLIRDASHNICETFKHSPVFRVGGDEFVAIMRGTDYEQRHSLMEMMRQKNDEGMRIGGPVVACGFSEWRPGTGETVEAVFERADAEMYKNKTALKENDAAVRAD